MPWSTPSARRRGLGISATARCSCSISKALCVCGPARWAPTRFNRHREFRRLSKPAAAAARGRDCAMAIGTQFLPMVLRSSALVGGLKYFYEKSGSEVLFYLHQFALGVIFLFPFLRRPVVRQPVRLPRQPARCALAQSYRQHHHCCHAVPGDQVGGFPDRNRDLACAALTTSAWRVGLHRSLCANL